MYNVVTPASLQLHNTISAASLIEFIQLTNAVVYDSTKVTSDYSPLIHLELGGCVNTWSLPTADSYDDTAFVLDIISSSSFTITWTSDTNSRDCEFDSSIQITDDANNLYDYLTVVHKKETFTTSGTSTVSADATTVITAQSSDIGTYTVTYTMTDISNSAITQSTTVNLLVI